MFTIGEIADRAMVQAYRDMRAAGILQTYGSPFTHEQNDELHMFIVLEVNRVANRTPGFNTSLVPFIIDLAFAVAMTEQHVIGSERYNAWRTYEVVLSSRALNANRN